MTPDEIKERIRPFIFWPSRRETAAKARQKRRLSSTSVNYLRWINLSMVLHHLTYERLHEELNADVVLLCLDCHGLCHRPTIRIYGPSSDTLYDLTRKLGLHPEHASKVVNALIELAHDNHDVLESLSIQLCT